MKKRYILNPASRCILNTGLGLVSLGYLFVLCHTLYYFESARELMSVPAMLEHISATLCIVVVFALVLDIAHKRDAHNTKK